VDARGQERAWTRSQGATIESYAYTGNYYPAKSWGDKAVHSEDQQIQIMVMRAKPFLTLEQSLTRSAVPAQ